MTTTTILVKTLIAPCDMGQCGGEITVVTDDDAQAYAVVRPRMTRFIEQDCDVVRNANGSITASCSAIDPDAGDTCNGSATFSTDALAATVAAPDEWVEFMDTMETEG